MKRCALVVAAALLLTSCQPSTIVSTLETVVAAAEVALPVLAAATGLPPATVGPIVSYLQAVDAAVGQASAILAGPGTAAQKSAAIVQAFAGIAAGCNCVPAGTPAAVVQVIEAVAQAVGKFLAGLPKATAAAPAAGPAPVNRTDRAKLAEIGRRAADNAAKVKALAK